jgi:hypothetical protein
MTSDRRRVLRRRLHVAQSEGGGGGGGVAAVVAAKAVDGCMITAGFARRVELSVNVPCIIIMQHRRCDACVALHSVWLGSKSR